MLSCMTLVRNMRFDANERLEEKQGLSANSKQSYKYDLEQFLDIVGERISETSLKIYQAQLANLKISAQKRKISACNQFLYFLYQKGEVASFYRLELAKQAEKKTEKPELLDLDSFWQEIQKASQQRIVTIPTSLLSELEPLMGQTYLFERTGKAYSRQWAFRQLESFVKEKGFSTLSAQALREQFILRQIEKKVDLYEIAKKLGLKTVLTLEKYR